MNELRIYRAQETDAACAASLADRLWSPSPERADEFRAIIVSDGAAVFIAEADGHPVGFAQCGLRHDYVEGMDSEGPVGYLEGVYVEPDYRRRGLARMLVSACEDWARGMGVSEFASDTQLGNEEGLYFHLGAGFEEAGRIICFIKKL